MAVYVTHDLAVVAQMADRIIVLRDGIIRLALLAKEALGHDPMKGIAVVFRGKRADRVKIVVWGGLVLYWKRRAFK